MSRSPSLGVNSRRRFQV